MDESHLFHKWGGGIAPDFPRIDHAEDEFLVTADGDRVVDAAAGAAVVNLGHSVPGLEEVVTDQLDEVSYLSTSHFTHDAPEKLAAKLARLAPGDLNAAFLANSGSEANETAFKLARSYHCETGNPNKSVVIGRWQSYHGATLGALSASGNTSRRAQYAPLLREWPHIPPAYPYRWEYEGTPERQAVAAAGELETAIEQAGPRNVAAFIAEPVSGSSIPAARPHPAYYREVRRICDEYDVLFIADEIMTGFGRTGPMFAVERYDVVPDMLVLGKGISAGYTPISAVMVAEHVAERFDGSAEEPFAHGHTFSGNPLSAAIGSHVVDQYTDDVLEAGRSRGRRLADALAPLGDRSIVGDLRHAGSMIGIEFVADRETKEPFDPSLNVADRIAHDAFERGVYTYPGSGSVEGHAGDHLMLAPPLTIREDVVDTVAETVTEAIDAVADELPERTA